MIVDIDSLQKDALEHSRKGKFMTMGGSEVVELTTELRGEIHLRRTLQVENEKLRAVVDASRDAVDLSWPHSEKIAAYYAALKALDSEKKASAK